MFVLPLVLVGASFKSQHFFYDEREFPGLLLKSQAFVILFPSRFYHHYYLNLLFSPWFMLSCVKHCSIQCHPHV